MPPECSIHGVSYDDHGCPMCREKARILAREEEVKARSREKARRSALAKLTAEEIDLLGLNAGRLQILGGMVIHT